VSHGRVANMANVRNEAQPPSSLSPGGLLPDAFQPFDRQEVDRLSSAKYSGSSLV
jgi:hypothetical protein